MHLQVTWIPWLLPLFGNGDLEQLEAGREPARPAEESQGEVDIGTGTAFRNERIRWEEC